MIIKIKSIIGVILLLASVFALTGMKAEKEGLKVLHVRKFGALLRLRTTTMKP